MFSVVILINYTTSGPYCVVYGIMLFLWLARAYKMCCNGKIYSANIPGKARLSGLLAKSVFNSKIEETAPYHQQAMGSDVIYGGKAKSKRCVFRYFLKVATELAKRRGSGRLFQRGGAQERKPLAPVLALTLGTDKLLTLFDLREREGIDAVSME